MAEPAFLHLVESPLVEQQRIDQPEVMQYGQISNNEQVAISDPIIVSTVPAQLPYLPEPLKLKHGPILATIETWSDGTVVARIPALAMYADGESDALALSDLGNEILSFAVGVRGLLTSGGKLAGPLLRQWTGLNEIVDCSPLEQV